MSGRGSYPSLAAASTGRDAANYDAHVVPRYSSLFGRLLLARIPDDERVQVLDVGCGTGHPALEMLTKLGPGGRVIAIDPDSELLDVARRRALDQAGRRIFFKVAHVEDLEFGTGVFDIVTANLTFAHWAHPEQALAEIRRVLVDDGLLLLTHALDGTFEEIFDMFREIALRRDNNQLTKRIERVAARYPAPATLAAVFEGAGFHDVAVETEEFQLPFRSAREIMSDPVMQLVASPEWRWIAGPKEEDQQVLDEVSRSLDTYFGGGPLSVRVRAGLVVARS